MTGSHLIGDAEAKRYRCIVADPPWKTRTGPMSFGGMGEGFVGGASASQPLSYPTMTVEEIKALQVADLAAENCHLYLWTTSRFLPAAFGVMAAWGFRYSSTQTWGKRLMGGGLGGTFRINSEFFLFGYRGKCDAKASVKGTWFDWEHEDSSLLFDWKRPYDERGKPKHSAKPAEFFEVVEQASHGPYLELFAREARDGWCRWGNEVDSTVELAA